ncbi:MAG: hypothetical protein WBN75_00020, partial [Verrucomicrobiia bacterium]
TGPAPFGGRGFGLLQRPLLNTTPVGRGFFIQNEWSGFLPEAATPVLQKFHIILFAVNLVHLCRTNLCFFVPLW